MNSILSYWNFNPANMFVLAVLCFVYLYAVDFRIKKRSVYFISALLLIIVCVDSPLYFLGENYLFSAHMTSHVALLLLAGPLLVASIPGKNRFSKSLLFLSKKIYKAPLVSWLTGVGIMWVWHIPYIFNQLVSMHGMQTSLPISMLMSAHMLSLIIAGMIFCWPIIGPYKQYRIASLTSVLYLSSACVFCSLLGLFITFAPAGTYTSYITADGSGILSIIRNQWNISGAADQQIGGLIMWVPCCFIYLSASMVILLKWFVGKDIHMMPIESNYTK